MRLHYYRAIIMDSDEGQIKSSYLVPFGSFHVHNVCNLSDVVVRCRGIDVVISTQCNSDIFTLDQNFHGLSYFWGLYTHVTVQNQSRKTSIIRLPNE